MNSKLELISQKITEIIYCMIKPLDIDVNEIIQIKALKALSEIRDIINNEHNSDFYKIEHIIHVFNKYNLDFDNYHDFY